MKPFLIGILILADQVRGLPQNERSRARHSPGRPPSHNREEEECREGVVYRAELVVLKA